MKKSNRKQIAKLFALLLTMAMLLGTANAIPASVAAETSIFSGGSGEIGDAFIITTLNQLLFLAEAVNAGHANYNDKYYKLGCDLDLSDSKWIPIGYFETCAFKGHFDGNGYTISGLTITVDHPQYDSMKPKSISPKSWMPETDFIGLFGCVFGGTVKNLTLTDVYIEADASRCVGGIIGQIYGGSVENCSVDGIVSGWDSVGGIAGESFDSDGKGGDIINCRSGADVNGLNNVGGIAGSASRVKNCLFTGTITCKNLGLTLIGRDLGGIAGSGGIIEDCVSTADVKGKNAVNSGGIVGYLSTGGVKNCFSTGAVSGAVAGGVVGCVDSFKGAAVYVENCAALNSDISSSGEVGRVVGQILVDDYSSFQLIAFSGMTHGSTAFTLGAEAKADGKDGKSIGAASLQKASGFPPVFTAAPWTYEKGKLPGLFGEAVEMPKHLRYAFEGISGDVNGDGKVNAIDASLILQYDAGLMEFDDDAFSAADIKDNGKVNALNASLILQYDAGLIEYFVSVEISWVECGNIESITVTAPEVVKTLYDYKNSFEIRKPTADELLDGACSYWVTFPDGTVIGLYRDISWADFDYGNIGTKIELIGNEMILPKGMATYVESLIP